MVKSFCLLIILPSSSFFIDWHRSWNHVITDELKRDWTKVQLSSIKQMGKKGNSSIILDVKRRSNENFSLKSKGWKEEAIETYDWKAKDERVMENNLFNFLPWRSFTMMIEDERNELVPIPQLRILWKDRKSLQTQTKYFSAKEWTL